EYTTSRVLVQERIPGRSVAGSGAFDGISAESRRALADGLLALTMRQMISGERFHADPHPGNVLICPDGRLGLIDFGAVGRLGRYERTGLIDIFRALQTEDPSLLRQAALHIGTPTGRLDADAFDRDLARLLAQAIRADGKLDTGLFADALGVFRDYGIVMPRSTTTLFRTLVTLLGTLEVISPGYQVTDAVRRLGPEAISGSLRPNSVKEFVQQQVLNTGPVLARLPRDLDEIARSLLRGELRTRVSLFTEPEDLRFIQSMFNRLITTVTGSVLTLASALLLAFAPQPERGVSLLTIVGGVGMTFSVLLLLRTLIQILRPQRPEQR
ncbi:MAG: hypothetical protein LBQ06_06260, partial [Frankiaceae bacterium]|nr:hypothetical protein [Frankiaceae bacterium]